MGDWDEVVRTVLQSLGPWPSAALVAVVVVFILTLVFFFASSIRLGPLAIELRRTARDLDELSIAMAESRIAELEIAARQPLLSESDARILRDQTSALTTILKRMRKST